MTAYRLKRRPASIHVSSFLEEEAFAIKIGDIIVAATALVTSSKGGLLWLMTEAKSKCIVTILSKPQRMLNTVYQYTVVEHYGRVMIDFSQYKVVPIDQHDDF